MNVFLVFLILGVIFLVFKKINSKKTKNLKLDKFKNKLQSTQPNLDRIFLREEEKTFSNPNIRNTTSIFISYLIFIFISTPKLLLVVKISFFIIP